MIIDLVQIKRLGEKSRAENLKFRKYLKSRGFVERQFRRAAEEVTSQIDCRECAECCRIPDVPISQRDVEKLSRFLGLPEAKFLEKHTARDEQGMLILLRQPSSGCTFLDGNLCTVYEARPGNCQRFPHLLRGQGSLESRMWTLVDRAAFCPIVYNWMEKVKSLTKFRG